MFRERERESESLSPRDDVSRSFLAVRRAASNVDWPGKPFETGMVFVDRFERQ